ncbi:MAG: RNA polymerase sigma-54 factor RpoN [Hydrogenibacillus schlegelii]|uniref:RNA polymerase sigma-54 factor RpoN n=1 Tax=Hydrogenibacillus schlegelii TaxID=1484 RepID=A0A2T5GEN7_HYDSH|nr:RNA polymerase factor sigma-54 [Hydrogenibacillus schlegelii]PTQ54625.1 MAG: RNA polymerase sigma-54 factor RpoN [Hydrogenibacillus schlegelii]
MIHRPEVGIEQKLKTELYITPDLQQSLDILTLGVTDLASYVNNVALDNPAIRVDPPTWQMSASFARRPHKKNRQPLDEKTPDPVMALKAPEPTLADRLKAALPTYQLDTELLKGTHLIIDALDERGYLGMPLEEISQRFNYPMDRLKKALEVVQSLDPPGIGARDLRECLHLQHRRLGEPLPVLTAIIEEHLLDVAKGQFKKIASRLRVSLEAVLEAVSLLKTFHPKPGKLYSTDSEPTVYIIPDAAVQNNTGTLEVRIYDDVLPRLTLEPDILQMLRHEKLDTQTKAYLARQVARANKLIEQLNARKTTLARVLHAVAHYQKDFFFYGFDHLKPLTMQTVAETVGLSVSTVSRAVRDKYIQTPWGVIEFKRLFPSAISGTEAQGEATSETVIRKIKAYIEAEDKTQPLSDEEIAAALNREGIYISRRTVAKYRSLSGIPSSQQRKHDKKAPENPFRKEIEPVYRH